MDQPLLHHCITKWEHSPQEERPEIRRKIEDCERKKQFRGILTQEELDSIASTKILNSRFADVEINPAAKLAALIVHATTPATPTELLDRLVNAGMPKNRVLEMFYSMATWMLALYRRYGLSSRLHYNVFSAIDAFEHRQNGGKEKSEACGDFYRFQEVESGNRRYALRKELTELRDKIREEEKTMTRNQNDDASTSKPVVDDNKEDEDGCKEEDDDGCNCKEEDKEDESEEEDESEDEEDESEEEEENGPQPPPLPPLLPTFSRAMQKQTISNIKNKINEALKNEFSKMSGPMKKIQDYLDGQPMNTLSDYPGELPEELKQESDRFDEYFDAVTETIKEAFDGLEFTGLLDKPHGEHLRPEVEILLFDAFRRYVRDVEAGEGDQFPQNPPPKVVALTAEQKYVANYNFEEHQLLKVFAPKAFGKTMALFNHAMNRIGDGEEVLYLFDGEKKKFESTDPKLLALTYREANKRYCKSQEINPTLEGYQLVRPGLTENEIYPYSLPLPGEVVETMRKAITWSKFLSSLLAI